METRTLGPDGPLLSLVGIGCNNFGARIEQDAVTAVVNAALDVGATHFDTAEMYGGGRSEELLRDALGSRRDEAVIATKVLPRPHDEPYTPGAMARRIEEGVELSLRRLGTDHIDLYYHHTPDPDAPIDETLEAFAALVASGKVLHIANSNYSAAQLDAAETTAVEHGWPRYVGSQIEWSLLERAVEDEVVPAAERLGIGVVPYFPLASGMLTGKYRRDEAYPEGTRLAKHPNAGKWANDDNFDRVDRYVAWAADHGHTVGELAIAWLLAQPSVTSVIAGATKPGQVMANAAAADWVLTPAEAAEVAAL